MLRVFVWTLAVVAVALSPAVGAEQHIGNTTVFARVPAPGWPEGIAVLDGVVYVGTHTGVLGNLGGPASRIFRFDLQNGASLGSTIVHGQNTSTIMHGILGMAFDAAGRLYVADQNPPRLLRFGPSGQETYATFPDLKPCVLFPPPCSPGLLAIRPAWPNYPAFDSHGNVYVTDFQAATIFHVPPGGGEGQIWFQDARLDSYFGPNGIAVSPDGTKLFIAMTASLQLASASLGIIYTLPLVDEPRAEDLKVFFTYLEPATGPDGIAFGASGKLYVALSGSNQVSILNPDGREAARFPGLVSTLLSNVTRPVPYDAPASLAFDGDGSILVTNHTFFTGLPSHWAVLRAWVDDTALPLIRPNVP